MSGIEAVIAAARRPGGFAERKTFSLARSRAIEKMRKFALANPHLYVLELVQAAVASGAVSIDVGVEGDDLTVSWVGTGHVSADELGQLFDFLFASKDRLDLAHVRALAVGINAGMTFVPQRVIVESGDASLGAAARLEIRDGGTTVDVGRSDRRFTGTYVRVEGLSTHAGWHGRDGAMEFGILESRCMELPVPLVFNGHAMFGFSSLRVPRLFGHQRTLSFDEGDLYGTLGLAKHDDQVVFKLLTYGVWVQSYQLPLLPKQAIGGIVCFNRLHKTADHSGFVRDERFEEMRLRLIPHAHELVRGRKVSTSVVRSAGGEALDIAGLRARLEGKTRVVLVPERVRDNPGQLARTRTIAEALEAEVLFASDEHMGGIRALAGLSCEVVTPEVDDDRDAMFYAAAPSDPPPGPYFLAPEAMPPLPVDELVAGLAEGEDGQAAALARLAGVSRVASTLYAPRDDGPWAEGLVVRVLTSGRVFAVSTVATTHPGFVLDVDLGTVAPASLRGAVDDAGEVSLAEEIARRLADLVMPRLGDRATRILAAVGVGDIAPNTAEAHLVLAAVARTVIVSLRSGPAGAPSVGLLLPRPPEHFDALAVPVAETLDGRALGLHDVAALLDRCGGTLFCVRTDIRPDLRGLDAGRLLRVDEATERALMTIFGPAAYVRVDAREVLAREGEVEVRDFAAGARARDGDGALDLEPGVTPPSGFDERPLLEALMALAVGDPAPVGGPRPEDDADRRERCRQAQLHLRHYALGRLAHRRPLPSRLDALVLARDLDDHPVTVADVRALAERGGQVSLLYGAGELPGFVKPAPNVGAIDDDPRTLVVTPAVARGLHAIFGEVGLGFGLDLRDGAPVSTRGSADQGWLCRVDVDERGFSGIIGIGAGDPAHDALMLVTADRRPLATLPALSRRLGVSGVLRVSAEVDAVEHELGALLERAAQSLWVRLVAELDDHARRGWLPRVEARMLAHLEAHTQFVADLSGHVEPRFDRPSAELLATLPLFFAVGRPPSSARRLVQGWSVALRRTGSETEALAALNLEPDRASSRWAHRVLRPWRIARQPTRRAAPPVPEAARAEAPLTLAGLAHNLQFWLERLRPDEHPSGRSVWILDYGAGLTTELERKVFEVYSTRLDISARHPLVKDALEAAPDDPRPLARLLAASYGRLNATYHEIANRHELEFLQRLSATLVAGALVAVASDAAFGGGATDQAASSGLTRRALFDVSRWG